MEINEITEKVIGAAIEVHRALGVVGLGAAVAVVAAATGGAVLAVRTAVDRRDVHVDVHVDAAHAVDEPGQPVEGEQSGGVELLDAGVAADRLRDELEALGGVGPVAARDPGAVAHGVGELRPVTTEAGGAERRDVDDEVTGQ